MLHQLFGGFEKIRSPASVRFALPRFFPAALSSARTFFTHPAMSSRRQKNFRFIHTSLLRGRFARNVKFVFLRQRPLPTLNIAESRPCHGDRGL
jgi:hypothetical protein